MIADVASRGRARDLAAGTAVLVWMLSFSILALKNHYALSRLSAEVEIATVQADVASLEGRIAALERQIERPSDADAPRDPSPMPARRRMK